ncbi:MAG: hypothetical protein JWN40_775 [Phycisphaerales bacterium]|nr:hypothetical protein [Phycisphaerales bacterium]
MSKRNRILLLILIPVVVTATLWGPATWRAGALKWAKVSAWRTLRQLTPEQRRDLATTPTPILLPQARTDVQLESATIDNYALRFPKAESRRDNSKSLVLAYPRFKVLILSPFPLAEFDDAARQLGYRDMFEQWSVVYAARPDEIETQSDLPSLQRLVLLLSLKTRKAGVATFASFNRTDLTGFITTRFSGDSNRFVAELFVPAAHTGCGVTFIDRGGMTLTDVEEFLATLQITPMTSTATNPAATSPSVR